MAGFGLIHVSDLHVGKTFGRLPGDIRGSLRGCRIDVVDGIARHAHGRGLRHVLMAGDTFDSEAPSLNDIRKTLEIMKDHAGIAWWVLPGNHDNLRADIIWDEFARAGLANVHVLARPEPVEMEDGVWLLPSPCLNRHPHEDPTAWMDDCVTPEGEYRIGMAHGGVVDFGGSEDETGGVILPERARDAGLDYLALGDWHGMLKVNGRTFYSGTPEHDRFKHEGRGKLLVVTFPSPGALPDVEAVPVGTYDWRGEELEVSPSMDAVERLGNLLPGANKRHCLVRLKVSGRVHPDERVRLLQAIRDAGADFFHFEWDDGALATEYSPDDLDSIASGGALRQAARELLDRAGDASLAARDRDVASAALNRLYGMVREMPE